MAAESIKFSQTLQELSNDSEFQYLFSEAHKYYKNSYYYKLPENFLKAFCIIDDKTGLHDFTSEWTENFSVKTVVKYLKYYLYVAITSAIFYTNFAEKPFYTPKGPKGRCVKLSAISGDSEIDADFILSKTRFRFLTAKFLIGVPSTTNPADWPWEGTAYEGNNLFIRRVDFEKVRSLLNSNTPYWEIPVEIEIRGAQPPRSPFTAPMSWLDKKALFDLVDSLEWRD